MSRDLPPRMHLKHGAYYLVVKNKWYRLGTTLDEALVAYAEHTQVIEGAGNSLHAV